MKQLALDLSARTDPVACPHREPFIDGVDRCMAHEDTFVNCARSVCGQPPSCAWEPLDNGAEAVARRLAWLEENKT